LIMIAKTESKRVTNRSYIGFLGEDQGYRDGEYWQIKLECGHRQTLLKKASLVKQAICPQCAKTGEK
ncbi:hypothetical protein LCGC14_3077130, partial [marine sediment metagenome]